MRHTLIPITLRKSLRFEYRARAGIVLLFMLSLAGVIGIVSLLPSFIHVLMEQRSIESTLASLEQNSSKNNSSNTVAEMTRQANTLALFNDMSEGQNNYSDYVKSVVGVRGAVKITALTVSRVATTTVNMTVRGVAPNREALLHFKSRLEEAMIGNKVDLPVSQLAKSKDIQYSLSITNEKAK